MPSSPTDPPPRLTMNAFWRDFGDEVFSLERGLPWTFWQLCRSPGALVRRYVDQRDPRVVRPLRWFLLGFALMALVFQSVGGAESAQEGFHVGLAGRSDQDAMAQAIWSVMANLQWVLLGAVFPAGAHALTVVYRRHEPEFAEMWVFCLYLAGQVLGVWALLLAFDQFLAVPGIAQAMLAMPAVWFIAACLGYFPGRGPSRWLRAVGALLLAAALTMLLVVGAVMLVLLFNLARGLA